VKIIISPPRVTSALPKNTISREDSVAKAVVAIVPMDMTKKQERLRSD